jgi:hypothetical protein
VILISLPSGIPAPFDARDVRALFVSILSVTIKFLHMMQLCFALVRLCEIAMARRVAFLSSLFIVSRFKVI